jgi:protein disulfide-isomerase
MKKYIFIFLVSIVSANTYSQNLFWENDMNKAIHFSIQEQKPLLLFFTGSDWCGWCMRLQKEVFETPEFENWAKNNVVLVELDFPRKIQQSSKIEKQNSELQQLFGVQGYPTVWFVNPTYNDGKINLEKLGSTGYVAGGPSSWLAGSNKIINELSRNINSTIKEIPLMYENGIYKLNININGLELKSAILDTGASTVSLSATEALFMLKQGNLKDSDFIGTSNFMTADGKITENAIVNLKEITIGDYKIYNIKASISYSLDAPILLGQSALQAFKNIVIDNERHMLIIK